MLVPQRSCKSGGAEEFGKFPHFYNKSFEALSGFDGILCGQLEGVGSAPDTLDAKVFVQQFALWPLLLEVIRETIFLLLFLRVE